MTALVIREWDVPKEEDRLKKYYTPSEVNWRDFMKKYKVKMTQWSQGIGHLVFLEEYERLDEFAKAWNDSEYKEYWTNL
jgi:hypothetical protein